MEAELADEKISDAGLPAKVYLYVSKAGNTPDEIAAMAADYHIQAVLQQNNQMILQIDKEAQADAFLERLTELGRVEYSGRNTGQDSITIQMIFGNAGSHVFTRTAGFHRKSLCFYNIFHKYEYTKINLIVYENNIHSILWKNEMMQRRNQNMVKGQALYQDTTTGQSRSCSQVDIHYEGGGRKGKRKQDPIIRAFGESPGVLAKSNTIRNYYYRYLHVGEEAAGRYGDAGRIQQ